MTRIIAIASGKGGVGKTTFATNFAIALNEFGQRTIVIDCNLTTPHLSYYLGAENYSLTINDILRGKVDIRDAVSSYNGVMFVPASLNPKELIDVDIKDLRSHLERLNLPLIDFVLLDCAPGLGREAVCALEAADEIIFVTTPTIPNLLDVKRTMEVINTKEKRIGLVLNMVGHGKYEFKTEDLKEIFSIPILGTIPFDKNVVDSVAYGMPVLKMKPNSPASISYMQLAANLLGVEFKVYPTLIQKIYAVLKAKLLKR